MRPWSTSSIPAGIVSSVASVPTGDPASIDELPNGACGRSASWSSVADTSIAAAEWNDVRHSRVAN